MITSGLLHFNSPLGGTRHILQYFHSEIMQMHIYGISAQIMLAAAVVTADACSPSCTKWQLMVCGFVRDQTVFNGTCAVKGPDTRWIKCLFEAGSVVWPRVFNHNWI